MAARDQSGFTLVELLVSMLAGIVIIAAVFALLDATLRQTNRTASKVDATQSGRVALGTLENELHSACVVTGLTPVQAGSDGSNLILITAWGSTAANLNSPSLTPVEHKISFTGTSITDALYQSTGGTAPNWTFSSTASQTATILANAGAVSGTPVFRYYNYSTPMNGASPYTDSAGHSYLIVQNGLNFVPGTTVRPAASPLTTPLSATDAGNTVEVEMNFVAYPDAASDVAAHAAGTSDAAGVSSTIQDHVDLRLTPGPNHASGSTTPAPCQ